MISETQTRQDNANLTWVTEINQFNSDYLSRPIKFFKSFHKRRLLVIIVLTVG